MNNRFYFICALSAALLLAGCQEKISEIVPVEATHSITFTAEKIIDTKTAIASEDGGVVSYKWIEGDEERMEILELYEVEVEKDGQTTIETRTNKGTITGMTLSNNDKSATFTAEFTGDAPSGTVQYQAAYAGDFSNSNNPKIPAAQSPLPNTFDPAADVLVSDLFDGGREETSFVFNMTRKVSVNKMTLKGLTPGEVISSVTFESDKSHSATYTLSTGNYSPDKKKLSFTYTANNTVPSTGEFPVYFTTAPVEDATFTVSVTTDQAKYRKTSSKTITFAVGSVRRFGVNLSGCEMPDGRIFTLVENVNDLVIGSDVVIAANGSKNIAMSTTQNTNNRGETDAAKSADYSTIEVSDLVQVFTLENGTTSGTYAFLCSNGAQAGKYIYAASSSSNYLRSQNNLDANASWTISISNKEATITAQGANTRNILRYNSSNTCFSCYATGQQSVFIYQAAGLPAAGLSFTNDSYTFTLGDSDYTSFTGQALNNPNSISDITWTSSNTSLATVDSDGNITWVPDATGTTTITAAFAGDDFFGAGNASYTITVNPVVSYDFETVAELNALVTSTSATYNGHLTDAIVSFVPNTGTAIVKDATGSVMFYKSSHGLLQGQTFTGDIEVTAIKYNNLYSEVTAWDASFTGSQASVAPESVTLSALNGHYDEYQNAYVSVAGLTVENIDGKNINVTDGTNSYVVYYNPGTPGCAVGDVITAVGTITKYQTTEELKVWSAAAITVTSHAVTYSTVAQVLSGGAGSYDIANLLVYDVNGKNVIVGDATGKMLLFMNNTLTAGDNITIESAAVTDYQGTLEITAGTISTNSTGNTVSHGTAANLNESAVASSTYNTFSATGYHSAVFVSMTGAQSGRNITGSNPNTTLYLNAANTTYDGKTVAVTGYIYSWSSSHSNYNFQLISIEEDTTTPTLSVSPSSLSWAASETDSKTLTVTLNGSAAAGDYTYSVTSGTASDWTITKNNGTLSVAPKAANTSTTVAKSITIRIAHTSDNSVNQDVICTQAMAAGGTTYEYTFTISPSDFNTSSYSANNGTHTSTAICTTDGSKSLTITWTSNQVYKNGNDMQWQKSNGYIFNNTDLGTIKTVTVNTTSGSFTTYYGASEHPTSGTTVGYGYFTVKTGSSAVGKTSSVVVTFEK